MKGTKDKNSRDEDHKEIADIVLTATDVATEVPKTYKWFDWNEESEDEDEVLKVIGGTSKPFLENPGTNEDFLTTLTPANLWAHKTTTKEIVLHLVMDL